VVPFSFCRWHAPRYAAAMRMLIVAVAAAWLVGCTRAPAEDFPVRPTTTASPALPPAASGAALGPAPADPLAGRCILPTPAKAPPPVAPGPALGCPRDPEGNQRVPIVHVLFPDAGGAAVDAELVTTEHDEERGLMYRRSMPDDHGMLFDLHTRSDHQFWMHNTCIPLDMVFVDVDGLVVGIVENAPTLDDSPRGVGCPSRYVLEVNAGWTRKHGVKAGQHMAIPAEAR
jgi:uncharacterized membrane protein (UPF0127 family)